MFRDSYQILKNKMAADALKCCQFESMLIKFSTLHEIILEISLHQTEYYHFCLNLENSLEVCLES